MHRLRLTLHQFLDQIRCARILGEKYAMAKHNENVTFTDYGVTIEEDDIESDEDQLQA